MSDQEFVNFENALNELKLSEDQLKRLVSEGEIRAKPEARFMRAGPFSRNRFSVR